jgi:hypothetical protein
MWIHDLDVLSKTFRKDRWEVTLKNGSQRITMANANYIWLLYNPSFEEIPPGYLVHHLDHDPTNDDPSNLALMQRYHHIAYHMKQKKVETKIILKDLESPVYAPTVFYGKKDGWQIHYIVRDVYGKNRKRRIYNKGNRGEKFTDRQDAEQFIIERWGIDPRQHAGHTPKSVPSKPTH